MFTATEAIAQLDAALLKAGEDVALQVTAAGATSSTVTARAFVRGYKPDQLAGDIKQGDGKVILSPTGLAAAPKQNDRVVVGGAGKVPRNVVAVETIRLAGTIVRYELQVRG